MSVRINRRLAYRVFDRLMTAFRRKSYPFSLPEAKPPQEGNTPKRFPSRRHHALYLFHACYYMRGTIRSDGAMTSLCALYLKRPDLFLPEHARHLKATELARILREAGLGYLTRQISRGWIRNAERLHRLHRGNPLRIFTGVDTYEEACYRIQNKGRRGFFGFQEKMVSMLIYFLVDGKLIEDFHFPPPVDFHALRIMFAHEIAVPDSYDVPINHRVWLADFRRLLFTYCLKRRVRPNDFCEATWLLSRILCVQHPGNTAWEDGPRAGRSTPIRLNIYEWNEAERSDYQFSCQQCPIQLSCKRLVPAKFYYIAGDIHASRRRDRPPEDDIPF